MLRTLNNIPVYSWFINEDDEETGVSVMSIVNDPAVDMAFLAYKNDYTQAKYAVDTEQHVITGVALRAGLPIYRNDSNGEYYTIFSADVIRRIAQKFMKQKHNGDVSLEHSEATNGAFLFESFFFRDGMQEVFPEFTNVEVGSWMVSYKIEDEALWQRIKDGDYTGFSVEMYGQLLPVEEKVAEYNRHTVHTATRLGRNKVRLERAKRKLSK